MNKQELINELKRISLEKQHKALTHPESKNYYEGMVMAYSQVVHMVNTVLKLDEPQKPVVPQFVAEWFEDNKHALDLAIFTKIRELDGKRYPHETDFENWLDNAENNPIETLIRMKDGPRGAIFEADGGAWRNQAIVNIREYLYEQLEEEIKSKRVTILA